MAELIYKKAEASIKNWLDRPEDGYSLDRIKDQMSGYYGSKNICDFVLFKSPNEYYIESKSTESDRFDFSMITEYQWKNLMKKSKIAHVYGWVIVLYVLHKRAFIFDINDIDALAKQGIKSLNINKIAKWPIAKYAEILTIPSRKEVLDYTGDIEDITWVGGN